MLFFDCNTQTNKTDWRWLSVKNKVVLFNFPPFSGWRVGCGWKVTVSYVSAAHSKSADYSEMCWLPREAMINDFFILFFFFCPFFNHKIRDNWLRHVAKARANFSPFFWGWWWWWSGWGVLGVRSFPGNIVIQCFFFLGYIHIANQWKLTVMDCVLKSSFIMMHSFLAGGWVGWEVVRGSYFLCKHRTFKNSTLFRNVLVAKEGHENVFFF